MRTLNHRFFPVLACFGALAIASSALSATRYVSAALATGANNGSSWADAYRGVGALQVALAASVSGDEIWVAAGTYRPSTTGIRTASFTMKTGVGIYGGFAGTEATREERNWTANATLLSGDLLGNDVGASNTSENSYHVVVGTAAASSAVLDGFTVQSGNANLSSGNSDKGGGILIVSSGAPTIRNCIFTANRCTFGGGAGYIFGAQATFTDCQFNANVGGTYGGAFDTNAVVSTFTRCAFRGNTAGRAGAVETYGGGNTTYINCLFAGNTATNSNGGAALWIGVSGSVVTVRNCTFASNTATVTAGGINTTSGGSANIANSIFWGNSGPGGATAAHQINNGGGTNTVSYCFVQGGFAGSANSNTDPKFVDAAAGDYSLASTSTAIDAGSNALVPANTLLDLAGMPRFVDIPDAADTGAGSAPIVDLGAYERQLPPPPPCPADLNGDGAVNGADLGILLGAFGGTGVADLNGDGIVDGADLGSMLGAWGPC